MREGREGRNAGAGRLSALLRPEVTKDNRAGGWDGPPLMTADCGSSEGETVIAVIDSRLWKKQASMGSDARVAARGEEEEDLWVDKYAPSSYIELLSDEKTNREVLTWIKAWAP